MIKEKYFCIKSSPDLTWKVGEIYEFSKWEVIQFDNTLISSRFTDWFLNEQQYREFLINKIIDG